MSDRSGPPPQVPASGREIVPVLWEVVARWRREAAGVREWPDALRLVPPRHQDWGSLVERLQLVNAFQWQQEDRSREPGAGDAVLAAVKRSIDASNGRRVRTVEALDALLHERLRAAGLLPGTAPLHGESPASVVDRLSVLVLKCENLEAAARVAAAGPVPAADPLRRRLEGLREQLEDLTGCLDRLLADLRAGRARFKLYRQVKVYRDPATGLPRPEADAAPDA